jgi:hypothetical protein
MASEVCNATDGGGGGGNFPQYKTLFKGNAVFKYAHILYVVKGTPTP